MSESMDEVSVDGGYRKDEIARKIRPLRLAANRLRAFSYRLLTKPLRSAAAELTQIDIAFISLCVGHVLDRHARACNRIDTQAFGEV